MSSLENIYMKMSPALEAADLANLHQEKPRPDAEKQIGREVAHELNNILTIIRGYSDRVLLRHGENPALRPDLQLISENVKRAESVIRHSTMPRVRPAVRAIAAAQPAA
jgi:signal transduction histidine kinase